MCGATCSLTTVGCKYLLLVLGSVLALAGGGISTPIMLGGLFEVNAFDRILYTTFLLAALQSHSHVRKPQPERETYENRSSKACVLESLENTPGRF